MKYTPTMFDLYTRASVSKACLPPPYQLRISLPYSWDIVPGLSTTHMTKLC